MADQLGVLSIGGHPKDPIIYSGGTLAKHAAQGDRVCVLSVTHGVRTHHFRAKEEMAKNPEKAPDIDALTREIEGELTAAANELGVTDVRSLRHDDEVVTVSQEIVSHIANVICDFRPDIIISHWPYDGLTAHAHSGQMTRLAIDAAGSIRSDRSQRSHGIKALCYHMLPAYTSIMESLMPRPLSTIVDITSVIQQKYRAMSHFRHQHYGGDDPFNRKESEIIDGIYAIQARVPYAEPYVLHKPMVFDTLPVSKYEMEIATHSIQEGLKYMGQMLLEP